MTTRRTLVVKGQGQDARVTFTLEAYRDTVWIIAHDAPFTCVAILEPAQADTLVELIAQTAHEAREHKTGSAR